MKKEEIKDKTTKKGTNTKEKEATKNTSTTKKQPTKSTSKKSNSTKKENTKTVTKKEKAAKVVVEEEVIEEELAEEVEDRIEKDLVKEENKPNSKGDIFLILGLVVVVILGCFLLKGQKPVLDYELPLTLSGEAGLHQLTYAEYQEKVDNNEQFVLVIERATCSHCVTYMPIAEEFANTNELPMYYVDTDTFTEEDWSGFTDSNSYLKKNSDSWGTPTTIVLAGDTAVDSIEGTTDAETLLELYNEYFEMEEE
ncbi:MAG: hypothetical protein IJ509_03435 [Bacilli bacterium]|nr:hypothetical protein [Bacilli bacterium]